MQKLHKEIWANLIIIFLVAIILTSIWFREGRMIAGGDSGLPFYNPLRLFNIIKYTWWGNLDTGGTYPATICANLFFFLLSRLQLLGLSYVLIQKILFGFLLLFSGFSMYYLTSLLIKDKSKHLVSLLASLFYMLNPYVMINVWHRFLPNSMFFIPVAPLFLILYIKGLEKKKISYAFLMIIISLFSSYIFGSPALIITFWLLLFTYFLFHLVLHRKNRPEIFYALKFSLVLIIFWLLLNLWWILPFLNTAPAFFAEGTTPWSNLQSLKGVSQVFTLFYILRGGLNANYPFIEQSWGPIYSSFIFQLISFLIPILVFSAVLFRPKEKWVLYFASLALFSLFLAKGASPPLGRIVCWLFLHFPLVGILRNPGEKLGIMIPLGYAFLYGVALNSLYHRAKKSRLHLKGARTLIIIICFLTLGLYPWPMWTGKVFETVRYDYQNFIEVPSYYDEADRWLSNQVDDFRILHLPLSPGDSTTFNWKHGYCGMEPSGIFFTRPSISKKTYVKYVDDIVQKSPKLLDSNHLKNFMGLLNVKFIVLHHEVDYEAREMDPPRKIEGALSKIEYMHPVKTFDQLDLYQISEQYFLPHIFASSRATLLEGGLDALVSLSSTRYLGNRPCLLFSEQLALCNQEDPVSKADTLVTYKEGKLRVKPIAQFKKTLPAQVSFKEINPTRYQVRVKAEGPFWLVFSETYHPQWKAYLRPVRSSEFGVRREKDKFEWSALVSAWKDRGKKKEIKEHFIANGYANGWWVPMGQFKIQNEKLKIEDIGNKPEEFEIVLEFVPQRLLEIGTIISGLALFASLGYLIVSGFRSKKKQGFYR